MSTEYAVVLAGGRSERMGTDKTRLLLEGRTLLERAVQACDGAARVIVAGPDSTLDSVTIAVEFAQEDPPLGGPVAGLAAALELLPAHPQPDDTVLVLACDLPAVATVVDTLRACELGVDGTVLVDDEGWPQYLAGRYRLRSLQRRAGEVRGARGLSMGRFARPLDVIRVPADPATTSDIDTPAHAEALGIKVNDPRRSPESDAANLALVATWQEQLRAELGVGEAPCDVSAILKLASVIAKRVARPGVPVTSYVVGLAVGSAMARGEDAQAAAEAAIAAAINAAESQPPAKGGSTSSWAT